jgi:ribose transport system ATP-binding protein
LNSQAIFRLNNITKSFPGVLALDQVTLEVKAGEVHGLVGENGAGKSTLIKIVTGAYTPDKGDIFFNGQTLSHLTPRKSMDLGIACIYQELNLIPHMAVYENIYLGREIYKKGLSIIDHKAMYRRSRELLSDLGLKIDPRIETGGLGVGQQQMVEISKAVNADAKMIIMDEPTASLSERESEELLHIIGELRKKGVTIVFISHRLDEVKEVCDSVTVLRDGKTVGSGAISEITVDDIIKMMVGRDITQKFPKVASKAGEELLSVSRLNRRGVLHDISLTVRAGEILGVAGLIGAGRTELARAITGADPFDSGEIRIQGKPVHIKSPKDSIRAGIAFLTEDRKSQGLILIQDIEFNSTLVNLGNYVRGGFLDLRAAKRDAVKMVEELRTRTPGVHIPAGNLSGGNQQKVVIAKWLLTRSKIFIIDEPTRGIDVGAKVEVYNLINELVAGGAAVIMISSEMDECIGMADRIIVMHEGRISAEYSRAEATQEKIMYAASGIAQSA